MTPNECTSLMCAFYKELPYEDMGTKKVKNVRVEEVRTFLKRLPGSMLDRFWIEITKKFVPTATVPFPTPAIIRSFNFSQYAKILSMSILCSHIRPHIVAT